MKEITDTIYVAADGRKFIDPWECEEYEDKYFEDKANFEKIPQNRISDLKTDESFLNPFFGCKEAVAILPRDEAEIDAIEEWFYRNECGDECLMYTNIDSIHIFRVFENGYYEYVGTPYVLKEQFCNAVDELCKIKEGE